MTAADAHALDIARGRREFEVEKTQATIAWARLRRARRLQHGLDELRSSPEDLRTQLTCRLLTIVRNMVLYFDQEGPLHQWLFCLHELVERHVRLIGMHLWGAYGQTLPNILEEVGRHWALPHGARMELDFLWDEIPELLEQVA